MPAASVARSRAGNCRSSATISRCVADQATSSTARPRAVMVSAICRRSAWHPVRARKPRSTNPPTQREAAESEQPRCAATAERLAAGC